jgi:hypothetical protein
LLAKELEKVSCVHEDFFFYRRGGAERGQSWMLRLALID